MVHPSRRTFLSRSLGLGGSALLLGPRLTHVSGAFEASLAAPERWRERGRKIRTLRFEGGHGRVGVAYGRGLSGRLRQDLSTLTPETLLTPTEHFYIRTRCPDAIDYGRPWRIRVRGLVEGPERLLIDTIAGRTRPMGVHLLECSGNGGDFGLMSAAEWTGVPVMEALAAHRLDDRGIRILIRGFDSHSSVPRASEAGASWVFTRRQLAESGAFLATGMNGGPLPKDHGHPVRLVMPGWYGCTCIKWVNEIVVVDDGQRATPHMREYAGRTHQSGMPRMARDFAAARIDLAAMPVRIEQWEIDGETVHRIVGIMWGGDKKTDRLQIRLGRRADYVAVDSYAHETTKTWTPWTHVWRPRRTGRYRIQLRVDDPGISTRRLDGGFYARTVNIKQV